MEGEEAEEKEDGRGFASSFSQRPHQGESKDGGDGDNDSNDGGRGGGGGGAAYGGPDHGDDGLVNGCDAGQMCLSCCCVTLCLGAISAKFFNFWPAALIFG